MDICSNFLQRLTDDKCIGLPKLAGLRVLVEEKVQVQVTARMVTVDAWAVKSRTKETAKLG